ncbi:MAG TPA: cyclase family protein [Candidatus Limnocylindrales bacterium]|nr:cyclase family protein [Candidatus Limnocylindrales bacterium]
MTGRLVDLSHPIESGMAGYPGLPAPRIEPHLSHEASRPAYGGEAEFEITRLFLVGNTGTYLDSPYHRHRGGADAAGLPLEWIAGLRGVCIDATPAAGHREIDPALELPAAIDGAAVLLRTGWDRRWGTGAYWQPGPFVGEALAVRLITAGARLVGVDCWNVDDTGDPRRPAHTALLGAGIPIVEHLRGLGALPRTGFRFTAVPAPIRRAASLPVRAFAELDTDDASGPG